MNKLQSLIPPRPHALVLQRGSALAGLAVADAGSPEVHVFDARSGATEPVAMVSTHRHPVAVMRYNEVHNTVISVDAKGGLRSH